RIVRDPAHPPVARPTGTVPQRAKRHCETLHRTPAHVNTTLRPTHHSPPPPPLADHANLTHLPGQRHPGSTMFTATAAPTELSGTIHQHRTTTWAVDPTHRHHTRSQNHQRTGRRRPRTSLYGAAAAGAFR